MMEVATFDHLGINLKTSKMPIVASYFCLYFYFLYSIDVIFHYTIVFVYIIYSIYNYTYNDIYNYIYNYIYVFQYTLWEDTWCVHAYILPDGLLGLMKVLHS